MKTNDMQCLITAQGHPSEAQTSASAIRGGASVTLPILASAAALLASGCASTYESSTSAPFRASTSQALILPEIEIGEKITGSWTVSRFFGFTFGSPEEFADGIVFNSGASASADPLKAAAAYQAVKSSGADFIVSPNYVVKNTGAFFGSTIVTVTGYKGKIKGFKAYSPNLISEQPKR
ncbi:MAG: hypothetical protein LBD14_03395 [Puniceicoccales bacterium]|nr:hypothetical protein [Puniceicoccales bacterium]